MSIIFETKKNISRMKLIEQESECNKYKYGKKMIKPFILFIYLQFRISSF